MKVIVGLGNPGSTYATTRHNIGWMCLGRLAQTQQTTITSRMRHLLKVVAVYGDYRDGTSTVRLVQPQTMMNHSGDALKMLRRDAYLNDLLIVCDDVNLPLGCVRLRAQGSDGGHLGLASCLEALGTEQVARMRLGVGGGRPGEDLTAFVLSPFTSAERPVVDTMIQRAVEACQMWVRAGIEEAMNRYNVANEE
jgi:PTH1 family peptidyl-tRNA hydrolase